MFICIKMTRWWGIQNSILLCSFGCMTGFTLFLVFQSGLCLQNYNPTTGTEKNVMWNVLEAEVLS